MRVIVRCGYDLRLMLGVRAGEHVATRAAPCQALLRAACGLHAAHGGTRAGAREAACWQAHEVGVEYLTSGAVLMHAQVEDMPPQLA